MVPDRPELSPRINAVARIVQPAKLIISEDMVVRRFTKLQQWISKLHRRAEAEPNEARKVLRQILEDLRRALGELRVIEEELRLQSDELTMARKNTEEQRQRYHQLLHFVPDGYLVTDTKGNIREANSAAGAMFGVQQEFLLGKPLGSLVPEDQKQDFQNKLTRIEELQRIQNWKVRFLPPGQRSPLHASLTVAAARDEQNRVIYLRWMIREIGETNQHQ